MRILYVVHALFPQFQGKAERVCMNVARAAQRSGHCVHVLACTMDIDTFLRTQSASATKPPVSVRTIHRGVPVSCVLGSRPRLSADFSVDSDEQLTSDLARWMATEKFDVAHILHPMWTDSALLAVQRSGLPYLVTLTDFFSFLQDTLGNIADKPCLGAEHEQRCGYVGLTPPSRRAREWTGSFDQEAAILGGAAFRTCPSEFVASRYRADFPGLSFSVIPHGIDMLALPGDDGDRTRLDSEIRLGYVDTLVPEKGVDVLLRAFARVLNTNLRLKMCCGNGGDDRFAQDIRQLADADPRVELLAPDSSAEVFRIIQSLNVICIPSRVPEAFSWVLHEAAAAGVPALVSALGAPGEMVAAYGSGMVLPPEDVDAWTAAIRRLSEQPSLAKDWATLVPLPLRVEEEAFFYEALYRQAHLA